MATKRIYLICFLLFKVGNCAEIVKSMREKQNPPDKGRHGATLIPGL